MLAAIVDKFLSSVNNWRMKYREIRFSWPSSFLTVLLAACAYCPAQAQIPTDGLKVFSAIDLVGEAGFENAQADTGRLKVRDFELATSAPIDPTFEAMLNLAGHDEGGSTEIELHEAYITSSHLLSSLSSGLRIKLGQFFLGIGRLNRYHSHDWPFTSPPKSHVQFFAEEAVIDKGVELAQTIDLGLENWSLDLTLGLTNGWNYGHSHTTGRRPLAGTHYVRAAFFRDLLNGRGLMLGLNFLGRTDADSVQTQLSGLDLVYKNRVGKILVSNFQMEIYHRLQSSKYLTSTEEFGGYFNYENTMDESGEWSIGSRFDFFTDLSLTFVNQDRRPNFDYAAVPYVSYRTSEFSTIRCSYFYGVETRQGDQARFEQRLEIQLIALFGAHPSHEF